MRSSFRGFQEVVPLRPYRRSSLVAAGALALAAAAAALVRPLGRVAVEGGSMRPALEPGDRLLVVRRRAYRPGTVVAVADPRDGRLLVKRVASVTADGRLVVVGDDPSASTDSRTFGPVPRSAVRGQAVHRYAPPGRTGPMPRPEGSPSLPSSTWTGTGSSACSTPPPSRT
jgi:nickel-type superoxide dismutase maturation protease